MNIYAELEGRYEVNTSYVSVFTCMVHDAVKIDLGLRVPLEEGKQELCV